MAERKGGGQVEEVDFLDLLEARVSEPGARGEKLREFIACQDDIARAVAKGYSLRLIWQVLREKGRITLAYGTFGNYVNRRIGRRARMSQVEASGGEKPVEGDGEPLDPEAARRKRLAGV